MIHSEDILYGIRMGVGLSLLPLTLAHIFVTTFPYDIPENSVYYPPWIRRKNEKMREQEKIDAYQKTYAYKYSTTNP